MKEPKEGNWFKRHKILTVLGVIIILAVAGSATQGSSNSGSDASTQAQSASEDKERLTLDEGWQLDTSNPYATKVVGTISNNSDKAIEGYIQVTFSALDADGANVGDCLANANTVDAGGKWKFEAICSGSNIATARFKDISGF